jgi:hypothetical protein
MPQEDRHPIVLFLVLLALVGFGYFLGVKTDQLVARRSVDAAREHLALCEDRLAETELVLEDAKALMGVIDDPVACPADYWCLQTPDGMVLSKACPAAPAIPEQCPTDCGCIWNPDGSIGATSCLDTSE